MLESMESQKKLAPAVATAPALPAEDYTLLSAPLERLIGRRSAKALEKLQLYTAEDLLFHVPFRFAKRGELLPIEAVREGEDVTVVAKVVEANIRPMRARRGFILRMVISDGAHDLGLTFFAKNSRPLNFHLMQLPVGARAVFSGTISTYRGALQLNHPEYQVLKDSEDAAAAHFDQPIPIYHATAKVPSWKIEKAVKTIWPLFNPQQFPDPLPETYRRQHELPDRYTALRQLHCPDSENSLAAARRRMKHEEALILQTVLARRKVQAQQQAAPKCPLRSEGLAAQLLSELPFALTPGQVQAGAEIAADMHSATPMRRLLQGDVGSGKTVVALRAMLQAIDNGKQAVLLAPTEVLAYQHAASLYRLLGDLASTRYRPWDGEKRADWERELHIEVLSSSLSMKEKRAALGRIASGQAQLIVGTHALLQERVQIPDLALLVIDEQHRFGVNQRAKLAAGVHMLVMTATPIPRTIAMTTFGDLEISTLPDLPAGRPEISTFLVPYWDNALAERVWERAQEEIAAGGRVYVVCPRISAYTAEIAAEGELFAGAAEAGKSAELGEASVTDLPASTLLPGGAENLENSENSENSEKPLHTVEEVYQMLQARPGFATSNLGILHGQLSSEEKDAAMADFAAGRTSLLVCTTVVEVGIDVPEATMMVIMDAERFGLSQLHQLRGRIGRGKKDSLCIALHQSPPGTFAFARLTAFAATRDGFQLAEKDLELRAEGNVLGARQSGKQTALRFLSALQDVDIIAAAKETALQLVEAENTESAESAENIESCSELWRLVAEAEEAAEVDYLEKS